ncbi:hypothetical protein, partial [Hyphomonas sp.]|uniref:hypothetical protein n=1 Tax=Hyphomonas sp. TaxID=87 RepID=UPI0025BFF175
MNRPLIYFDQNLLCDPIEAIINSDKYEIWRDTVSIAYSDETILEIIRSVGLEDRILGNLEKFHTVRVCRELINFKQTDRFLWGPQNPRQRFEELRSDPFFMSPGLNGLASLHKSFGGQQDKSYQNILDDQMIALSHALSSALNDTGLTQSEIDALVSLLPNSAGVLDEDVLEQAMGSGASSSPALQFQKALG